MRHAIRKAGLTPMKVGRVSSATRHCQPGSGQLGSPSSITIDERTRSAATSAFHIIQEVVLNQSRRPPGFRSQLSACALRYLEQDAAVPVDDRLRPACRPGREQHEQRVVEGDRLERERPGLGEQLVPGERVRDLVLAVGDVHDVAQRGQGGADRRHLLAAVDRAVAEAVPADGQQHRRLELREAVDDAARAELGRAARPDRSEARRRRERDERLGDVRQVGDDAVARADAEPHEAGPGARHLLAEVREGELGRLARLGVGRRRDLARRPRRGRAGARRSSAARPGTRSRRASRRRRGPCCTGRAPSPRRNPRSTTRTPARSSTDQRHSSS